jgi:hypothetical protein
MEVTKALAALQPLYGKGNVEIVTAEGIRIRGIVRSMKTTQALSTPSVKVERADGEIVVFHVHHRNYQSEPSSATRDTYDRER